MYIIHTLYKVTLNDISSFVHMYSGKEDLADCTETNWK